MSSSTSLPSTKNEVSSSIVSSSPIELMWYRRLHWLIPYTFDWLLLIIVFVIPLYFIEFSMSFEERRFSLLDASIRQPYHGSDTFAIYVVAVIGLVVPIIFFFVYSYLLARKYSKSIRSAMAYGYWWSCGLLRSLLITVLLTELIKKLVQSFRPDWVDRCFDGQIPTNMLQPSTSDGTYIHSTHECTQSSKSVLEEGMSSFPSGHTSIAWCCSLTLSLFFFSLLHTWQNRTEQQKAHRRQLRQQQLQCRASHILPNKKNSNGNGHLTSHSTVPDSNSIPSPLCELNNDPTLSISAAAAVRGPIPPSLDAIDDIESQLPSTVQITPTPESFWSFTHIFQLIHIYAPLVFACAVSFSRAMDNKHHLRDIVGGTVIGIVCAWTVHASHVLSYQYYCNRLMEITHHSKTSANQNKPIQTDSTLTMLPDVSAAGGNHLLASMNGYDDYNKDHVSASHSNVSNSVPFTPTIPFSKPTSNTYTRTNEFVPLQSVSINDPLDSESTMKASIASSLMPRRPSNTFIHRNESMRK